jgi:hypothetical protein
MSNVTEVLSKMSKELGVYFSDIGPCFEQMSWAEEEIKSAIRRHPSEKDSLWHSFSLLQATHRNMATEFVYRAHCRELLDRVAAGTPTTDGTAAEAVCVCSDTSKLAPFNGPGFGLYARMWAKAFPDKPMDGLDRDNYEALFSARIDELELELHVRQRVDDRKLGEIKCAGMHHGAQVQCKYAG